MLGIAVLATVFASNGSYESPQAYTDGMTSTVCAIAEQRPVTTRHHRRQVARLDARSPMPDPVRPAAPAA